MHQDLKDAIDLIDAAIFTGDTFLDEKVRGEMRELLARWDRGLQTCEDVASSSEPMEEDTDAG